MPIDLAIEKEEVAPPPLKPAEALAKIWALIDPDYKGELPKPAEIVQQFAKAWANRSVDNGDQAAIMASLDEENKRLRASQRELSVLEDEVAVLRKICRDKGLSV